jgi:hypothetical protein
MKKLPVILFLFFYQAASAQVQVKNNFKTARTNFAVQKLQAAIAEARLDKTKYLITIDTAFTNRKESFSISTGKGSTVISGNDESGILYGCLELAGRIKAAKAFPASLQFKDAPEMVLRGACIGLQKSTYLPGRNVYEYPITPETFSWFYDKHLWIQVLDSMLENRMNSLYLWNGHPFASLVKLKEYPYAVEVDDATLKKKEEK